MMFSEELYDAFGRTIPLWPVELRGLCSASGKGPFGWVGNGWKSFSALQQQVQQHQETITEMMTQLL